MEQAESSFPYQVVTSWVQQVLDQFHVDLDVAHGHGVSVERVGVALIEYLCK